MRSAPYQNLAHADGAYAYDCDLPTPALDANCPLALFMSFAWQGVVAEQR
jgi:hypothetical protein